MVNCGNLLKSALVAVMLVAVAQYGSAAEKLATCCKTVTNKELHEPILGYLVQRANPPCVQAVIFQTESGLYCSQLNAPWVRRKIVEFRKQKAQATTPSSSSSRLLSIITSTVSPPSSSSFPSSSSPSSSFPSSSSPFPSTFQTPAEESASEKNE
uniref:Chemokine interleukin-8-like domain-containing protein n=1 Tax=Sphaeramia orbicularis TaxID=375764 RepID=A0A673CUA3_9TELE